MDDGDEYLDTRTNPGMCVWCLIVLKETNYQEEEKEEKLDEWMNDDMPNLKMVYRDERF